jgi:hypothetical protein
MSGSYLLLDARQQVLHNVNTPCSLFSHVLSFMLDLLCSFQGPDASPDAVPGPSGPDWPSAWQAKNRITWIGSDYPDVVGSSGLEPPTLRLSGVRSNQLSYEPG